MCDWTILSWLVWPFKVLQPVEMDCGIFSKVTLVSLLNGKKKATNKWSWPLFAAFRSPQMKALDRSVRTLGLWIVTSSSSYQTMPNLVKKCILSGVAFLQFSHLNSFCIYISSLVWLFNQLVKLAKNSKPEKTAKSLSTG